MASSCRILSVLPSTSIGSGVADASFFNSSNLAEPMLYSSCKRSCSATAATTACLAISKRLAALGHVLLTLVQPLSGVTMTRTHPCLVDDTL